MSIGGRNIGRGLGLSEGFRACLILLILLQLLPAATGEFQELGTTIKIQLHRDGTARWTFLKKLNLTDEDQVEAFERFAEEQELNRSNLISEFSSRFDSIVGKAATLTNRSMRAYDYNVSFSISPIITGGSIGLIEYSFSWEGFAVKTDSRLVIGDVFEGGFYLYDGDRLIVSYPSDYSVSSVVPSPDQATSTEITWFGRRIFEAGRPSVELRSRIVNVTLYPTNEEVNVGHPMSVLGRITPAYRLSLSIVYLRPNGTSFERLVTSSLDGTFNDTTQADQEGTYKILARWIGSEQLNPAESNIVTVKTVAAHAPTITNVTILLHLSTDRAEVGQSLTITGKVIPALVLNLTLTSLRPGGSMSEVYLRTHANGTFEHQMKVDQEGNYSFIVNWNGNESVNPAQSNPVTAVAYQTFSGIIMSHWIEIALVSLIAVPGAYFAWRSINMSRKIEGEIPPDVRERDEAIVLSILKSKGGSLPQSEIKRHTRFSKAKTSFILKSLQDKGHIWKEKWGREFIVHLKAEADR